MTVLVWHRSGSLSPGDPIGELPLVLLHAFPFDASMWDAVARELDDIPVLTVDAPGFGSPIPPGEPALEPYAEAVLADLADLGVDRAVIAGLSMGGYTAMAIADDSPGVLAGIGLLDTKATADDEAGRANRLDAAARAEAGAGAAVVAGMADTALSPATLADRPEVVTDVRARLAAASTPGIAWAQRAMAARPTRVEALENLDVPALVARGADDAFSSPEATRQMAEALSRSEYVEIPDAGHLPNFEQPVAVAQALYALYLRAVRDVGA